MSYFSWGKLFVSENYTPKKMGIFRKLFLSFTLPQTNSSSLKIGHPKRKRVFQPSNCRLVSISFIFQPSIFTGELTGFASFPPNGSVSKVILGPFMPKTKEKRLDLAMLTKRSCENNSLVVEPTHLKNMSVVKLNHLPR